MIGAAKEKERGTDKERGWRQGGRYRRGERVGEREERERIAEIIVLIEGVILNVKQIINNNCSVISRFYIVCKHLLEQLQVVIYRLL